MIRIILRAPAHLARARDLLAAVKPDAEHPQEMILQEHEDEHSREQQKYYRANLAEAAKELGYSPGELHEVLLVKYFGGKTLRLGDTECTVPNRRTTTDESGERNPLPKKTMRTFSEWALAFLDTELGVK